MDDKKQITDASGLGEHADAVISEHLRWLEEVRKDCVRYKEDPVVETFRLRENVYSIYAKCPHEQGDVWSHLIIGEKKALLIDTGFGIGDLKSLVEKLSGDKQIIVVNTHGGGDHSLGNGAFKKVYCHEKEAHVLQAQMYPEFWAEFCRVKDHSFFSDQDVVPFQTYDIIPCENHHQFDLGGGLAVEMIWLPGHAAGHCAFLDKKDRILFSGDALVDLYVPVGGPLKAFQQYPDCMTVQAFRDELSRLAARIGEFDCIFGGHGKLGIPVGIVADMLKACEDVLADPHNSYEVLRNARNGVTKVHFYHSAGLCYSDNRVYRQEEKPEGEKKDGQI